MPLMRQIMQIEDEWDRIEIFSDILFGVDSLIYLIDDAASVDE